MQGNRSIGQTPKTRHQGVNCALPDALYNDIDAASLKKHESIRDRRILELATQGYTNREIATAVDRNVNTVSRSLRQPWAREYMIKRMQQTANNEIKEILERAAPEAIKRIVDLAEKAKGTKLGFAADETILDRFMGKAVQPISTDPKDFDKLSDADLAAIAAQGVETPVPV